ncbi:MAG: cyanophycinase [Planctomycetota bacterium]
MRRLPWLSCCRAAAFAALAVAPFAACGAVADAAPPTAACGSLLLVGGGLDDDARPVYERLLALAARAGHVRVVVMTAATGPQDEEATDKAEALRTWVPAVPVEVVRRETPTAATVAAIDRASALLFTGGDQERITARYRPDGADTPEWLAMRRLLDRGGVIAGCSAGCAMMGQRMLTGGRSAQALGIARAPAANGGAGQGAGAATTNVASVATVAEATPLGPQLGPGMKFLPWGLTDSHFFERDRTGRLVAALAATGERFGLAVGEDAAVAIDLATGDVTGVTAAESLLVDAAWIAPSDAGFVGLRARPIGQGDTVSLRAPKPAAAPPPLPPAIARTVPIVEPGQNRQLAMWRVFRQAAVPGAGVHALQLDGWRVRAVADGDGGVAFAVEVVR